jgi:hypothetical protein
MVVDDVLQTRLRCRQSGANSDWRIWEHKTFNMHRGVVQWRLNHEAMSYDQMAQAVSERVQESFRLSWWRGFAFGALIESPTIPQDIAKIEATIDTRANSKGTWEWTVLACPQAQITVGVHTWAEVYLSPVYRGLIAYYESIGFQVGSFKKEKDKLMQFLTTVGRFKGPKFVEFEP